MKSIANCALTSVNGGWKGSHGEAAGSPRLPQVSREAPTAPSQREAVRGCHSQEPRCSKGHLPLAWHPPVPAAQEEFQPRLRSVCYQNRVLIEGLGAQHRQLLVAEHGHKLLHSQVDKRGDELLSTPSLEWISDRRLQDVEEVFTMLTRLPHLRRRILIRLFCRTLGILTDTALGARDGNYYLGFGVQGIIPLK